jgi:hypothetical protein
MHRKKVLAALVSSLFLALPAAVLAQTTTTTTTTSTSTGTNSTSTVPTDRLVQKYTTLAGSQDNAKSLVSGLRNGTEVKLSSGTGTTSSSTSFTSPTGKLGYGNINIALSLAEASLKQQGITNPTPEQLQAALVGTSSTTSGSTTQAGILQMRADGKGWGQIANSMGFKLGEVMRSGKADSASSAARADSKLERTAAKNDRAERPVKVDRVERVDRPQKPDRPDRATR